MFTVASGTRKSFKVWLKKPLPLLKKAFPFLHLPPIGPVRPFSMSTSPLSGDLARLLDTERQLEERLRGARAEGEALVAQARAAAEQRESETVVQLRADEERLAQRLVAERQHREQEIHTAARAEAQRYDGVPAARIHEIAGRLAQRLVTGAHA
jgi:hypothetical protein